MSSDEEGDAVDFTPKKATSFTTLEIELLLELVNKRKAVLECHKTGLGSRDTKRNEWILIQNEFNSDKDTENRTGDQLKKKWENLKRLAKGDVSAHKRAVKKTGGGPEPKPIPVTSQKVSAIIPSQMKGLSNDFDCDSGGVNTSPGNKSKRSVTPLASEIVIISNQNNCDLPAHEGLKRKKSGPRSSLVDWEYEEHLVRMKTQAITHEVELQRLKKIKLEIEGSLEENELRKQLISAQIVQVTGSKFIISEGSG